MTLERKDAPNTFIPTFIIWIFLCNITAIIMAVIWWVYFPETFFFNALISMIIIIGINIASIIYLYPMFGMDPITTFLKGALIWFTVVSIVYIVLGAFIFLIPGIIQLMGDLWFHWRRKRLIEGK
ncbi:MAG: hypothetical protein EU547_01700 [Promethearchaeota archaeon]|nr:MAG: hypothetical protein EU547_01700 [Candidatus Lokiarchaeota archaeon]